MQLLQAPRAQHFHLYFLQTSSEVEFMILLIGRMIHWKRKPEYDEDRVFLFMGKGNTHAILYLHSKENETQYHSQEHNNYTKTLLYFGNYL